jgi:hypothetical protein
MWPFKKKRKTRDTYSSAGPCPQCGGTNVVASADGPVKTWRGETAGAWRCVDCGRQFYADAIPSQNDLDDGMVDDPEALRQAEEELRRQTDEENDRLYRP